jgi:putative membrane protein
MHRLYFTLKFLGMQDKVYNNRFNWVLPRLATGFIRRFYLAQGQSLQAEGIKGGSLGKIQAKSGKVVKKMLGMIIRFIVSALVLMFVGFVVPGFRVGGFGGALVASVIIALLGYLAEKLFGRNVSPQSRGIVGFLTSAVVIYLTQFIVSGVRVTVVGALLSALVIGIIDAFVPTELR